MPLLSVLLLVFLAGALGGVVNALLSENGFILPKKIPVNASNGVSIWRPGYLGNILIGAVAAIVSWGLYGPFSSAYLFGSSPTSETEITKFGLTLSAFVGAILVGVGGAKWLSDEVDKRLLKAAASEAAKKEAAPEASRQISLSSPVTALNIAKNM
ncbi:hypothetical protein [Chroococcidiopsis sp. CCMEE 29]|uniref:hypothetical protein n=1 Tax=Chroococcidiopsis sp. CCMEE 29 TaxID=155894 RepID=UPI0020219E86|nr:hypothetical protein [Chroococcidiopsis sp. CCMEE 29]